VQPRARNLPEVEGRQASTAAAPQTAADASTAFARGLPQSEALSEAMSILPVRLGARHAALYVADPKRRTVEVEACYRLEPEDLRPRYGGGVAGRVIENGHPIVVPAVCQEPMALVELTKPSAWRDHGLSLVCAPLSSHGRRLGALSLYFSGAGATLADRVATVMAMASAAAPTLPSTRSPSPESPPGRVIERSAFEYANMIGTSAVMRQIYEEIGQVAGTSATALILGESGTGKELVAQAIHANSDRARGPFVKVNGAAFPEGLFESELFGHERGAFTGAFGRRKGRLDLAQGGTLFLDEIGELSVSTQVKLLRVLQTREYERLGGTETLKADIRLIAATNKDMPAAIANGTFREDLYYRLNVFTILLPPLRDRTADIPALADFFLKKFAREHHREVQLISSGASDALCRHTWPGNVRELENAIERAVVACKGPVVEERHLPEALRGVGSEPVGSRSSLAEAVEQLERRMIDEALEESGGNFARAARLLGTTERIARYKAQKYGLAMGRRRG
jgi:Nif-specific regulatory protein